MPELSAQDNNTPQYSDNPIHKASELTGMVNFKETNKYTETNDPPLVDIKVTNPITYLKLWLKKLLKNDGIDIHIKIKILTAVIILAFLTGTGFTLKILGFFFPDLPIIGQTSVSAPTITPSPIPSPTSNLTYQTTFYGILRKASNNNFYLLTTSSEVITLTLPNNLNLTKQLGKRILATGTFNKLTNTLEVSQTSQLEVLPTTPQSIPTLISTPTLTPNPTLTATPISQ